MSMPLRISSVAFNAEGVEVDLSQVDIVVLVGPNNSGKSRSLQEVTELLHTQPHQGVNPRTLHVLDGIAVDKSLNGSEFRQWLKDRSVSWTDENLQEHVKTASGSEVSLDQAQNLWEASSDFRLGQLAGHLMRPLWCGERLNHLGSPARIEPTARPEHPIHWLVRDSGLLKAFGDAFKGAFGMNVVLDAWGTNIRLRVSRDLEQHDFESVTMNGLPDADLTARLEGVPLIESQSDGVRSFAGVILTLLAAQYPLVLLDEPEAFLHPPQARLLGRKLAELQREGQLFVATHSLDVLLGLIESRPERVMILRLTRESERTTCQSLPPDQLARLWQDPLLQFSRALDGLFHDGVVVCEGDTDSQFYSAVRGILGTDHGGHDLDIMFSYAGGKHRIPLITNALRAVGVPVRAIVDFDALRDESVLRALVEGMGATFSDEMRTDRQLVDAHIRGDSRPPLVGTVRDEVAAILDGDPASALDADQTKRIRGLLEPASGWHGAKRNGSASVPSGDSTVALTRLLGALKAAGLFVVPVGEVESFVKGVGGKGPRWVVDVIEGGHLKDADEAKRFMGELVTSLPSKR